MPFNIPNLITLFRIALIPVFIGIYYVSDATLSLHYKHVLGTFVFWLASVSDWLDGYLARKLNQHSAFGAFLDPVADKLMVTAALILLVNFKQLDPFWHLDSIIAFIIIGREIAISALREWMAKVGESKSTAVSMLGKVKTTFQMLAIMFLLYQERLLGVDTAWVGAWLIYFAAVLTLWSMVYYLLLARTPAPAKEGGKH
jgi:CDP-diacylglycerol--glycerol-3-phosphate 3-phosphatidyltransferase/cardiolipin synthase